MGRGVERGWRLMCGLDLSLVKLERVGAIMLGLGVLLEAHGFCSRILMACTSCCLEINP